MKVLFTAVGSIGSRHIRNLEKICRGRGIDIEIDVIRKSDRSLPSELKRLIRNEFRDSEVIGENYDITFITDETGSHFESIRRYENNSRNFFIEKPVFNDIGYDINPIVDKDPGRVFYVAAPIRHSKYYATIKKIIQDNHIISARVIFSDYMPGWQKGRDYTKSFRCYKSRGGGVDLDSIHEIDLVLNLFGQPLQVFKMGGHYSELKMDADDIATYLFRYDDKVVEIHLDYFGRIRNRSIELYTDTDIITVDFDKAESEWRASGKSVSYGPDRDFYEDEMSYFLDLVMGKETENINDVEKAIRTLTIARNK